MSMRANFVKDELSKIFNLLNESYEYAVIARLEKSCLGSFCTPLSFFCFYRIGTNVFFKKTNCRAEISSVVRKRSNIPILRKSILWVKAHTSQRPKRRELIPVSLT